MVSCGSGTASRIGAAPVRRASAAAPGCHGGRIGCRAQSSASRAAATPVDHAAAGGRADRRLQSSGGSPAPAGRRQRAGRPASAGPVTISGWQSTGAEGDALTQTLCAAQAALPNLQITYQPIVGDYQAVMAANIAAHDVPDLFYVNADYAQELDRPDLPAAAR